MAQLKDLTVSGDARIIGNLYDNNPRIGFGTCSTTADTAIKVVVIDDPTWTLKVGNIIGVHFTNTNTAALVKLNVNNSGAIHIAYDTDRPFINTDSLVCGYAGRTIYYQYDGTYWNWISGGYSSGGGGGEYLPLSGGTMTGQIKGTLGGSWIQDRDKATVRNNNGSTDDGYHPVVSQKTKDGNWTIGQLSGENSLTFSYTTDTDYNNNNNANVRFTISPSGVYSGTATNVTQKKSLTAKSHSNYGTNNGYVPDMSFIAYWNGAYNSSGNSNLTYCDKGAFGDACVKGVATSPSSGGTGLITSGGVYSAINGKLIDSSGTNWIRYQDGTQICWGSIAKSNVAITSPWGALYESASLSLGNFPKAFKTNTTPQLFLQCAAGYAVTPEMVQPTATSLGSCYFYRPTSVPSAAFTVFYLAIGKWK